MSRYDNIKKKNIVTKGNVYDSVLLPYFAPDDTDIVIVTEAEDRLDMLAHHYFGDATLWWVIAAKNNLTDIDLKLKPGTQLRIPTILSNITDAIQ